MVIDPFCGRGTTPLEACLSGRIGIGNDLNPLAYHLTRAKTQVPSYGRVLSRLQDLEMQYEPIPRAQGLLDSYRNLSKSAAEIQEGKPSENPGLDRKTWEHLTALIRQLRELYVDSDPDMPYFFSQDYDFRQESAENIGYNESFHHKIWLFYHPETLRQLVYLKHKLGDQPEDEFIRALILGIMHGRGKHYLSLPMPNTFSMTPRYVLAYSYKNMLILPEKNVFNCLRRKMALINPLPTTYVQGAAFCSDIRDLPGVLQPFLSSAGQRPKLLVSSPPYLGVIKYGQYNWIRLWFLEKEEGSGNSSSGETLEKKVDSILDDGHHDLEGYLEFMRESLQSMLHIMAPKSISAWVIGDVGDLNLAEAVWERSAKPLGEYKRLDIIADKIDESKKVTKIWGKERGRATKIDRILILEKA